MYCCIWVYFDAWWITSCLPLCSVCVTQSIFQSASFKLFSWKRFISDENFERFSGEKFQNSEHKNWTFFCFQLANEKSGRRHNFDVYWFFKWKRGWTNQKAICHMMRHWQDCVTWLSHEHVTWPGHMILVAGSKLKSSRQDFVV